MKTTNAIFKTIKTAIFAGVLACASITAPPASAQDITTGLVGHWKLDETTGTTIIDESGNGNTGTWTSDDSPATVKSSAGMVGNAISFDDLDDGVSLGDNDNFDMTGTNAFTVSAWVKPALTAKDNGTATIFARGDTNAGPSGVVYNFFINSANRWQSEISDGTSEAGIFSEVGTVDFGQWQHMTLTWDGTNIILYKNGAELQNNSNPGFILHDGGFGNSGETGFGYEARQNNHHFDGDLDEMRVYNRALTANDVETLYSQTGAQNGYFVLIGNQPTNAEVNEFDGDLGGLAGANATCMNYLTNYDWKGKNIAQANGMLTPDNVKAWLCDDNGCQNFRPNTPYSFAKTEAGEEDTGGASFTSDSNGLYPASDTNAWDGDGYFARNTFFWTGREDDQTNTPATNIDCANWTSNASGGTILGNTGQTTQIDAGRWNSTSGPLDCDTTDQFVCFVNPVRPHTICNPNHTGKIIFNQDVSTMQYCNGTDWINMGKESSLIHGTKARGEDYAINAVEFIRAEGDNIERNDEIGASDTKIWTGSFWVNPSLITGTAFGDVIYNGVVRQIISITSTGQIRFRAQNPSATTILDLTTPASSIALNQWHHVAYSFDLSDPAKRYVYINDVLQTLNVSDYTDDLIDHSTYNHSVGANTNEADGITGSLADFWMDTNDFIDLSIEANRRKFINANGQAVNLGTDGSRPTGSAPDIFLSGDTADWHTNKGTGGGFNENGALTDATTTPPTSSKQKLVGWWKLDETSGTTAYDSTGNGNDGTISNMTADVATISGPIYTGMEFANNNEFINLGNSGVFDLTKELTLSTWFKPDFGNTYNRLIFKSSAYAIETRSTGTQLCFLDLGGSSSACQAVSLNEQEWFHAAATYNDNSDEINIYLNGTLLGTTSYSPSLSISTNNVILGDVVGRSPQAIDDIRIYNYALSDAEVEELYNSSSTFYQPNAVTINRNTETDQVIGAHGIAADSSILTGSFWALRDGSELYITTGSAAGGINLVLQNIFTIQAHNGANTRILDVDTNAVGIADEWQHILFSIDLSDPTKRHIYVDDVATTNTFDTYTNDLINYTIGGHENLRLPASGSTSIESIAEFWLTTDTYIDFSIESNRRKFTDAYGNARYLGANGELPTGSPPDIFLSGDTVNWHTNKGSGTGFTENGALSDATSTPPGEKQPRYCANPALPAGTLIFNTDEDVMQYCDGYQYIPLGPQGDGGASCSNPNGVAGSLIFNTDFDTLQYCEGDEWVGIGNDPTVGILAQGLIAHWRLDETSGTVINDISGNNYDSTADISVTSTAGAVGNAITFGTGEDEIINTEDAFDNLSNLTTCAWIRPSNVAAIAAQIIVAKSNNGYAQAWQFYIENSGRLTYYNSERDTFQTAAGIIQDNNWYHICASKDGSSPDTSNTVVYVNGTALSTTYTDAGGTDNDATYDLAIGASVDGNWDFRGEIDDVRIYDRVLSAGEITALYNIGDCPNVGDVCDDGSINAGITPDGNVKMFTTPANVGTYPWNNAGNTGGGLVDTPLDNNCTNNRCITGESNTNALVTYDADIITGGFQDHEAAKACYDLIAHGKSDWYLPARDEIFILQINNALLNFDNTIRHWSSSESGSGGAISSRENTLGAPEITSFKPGVLGVRCVRKD